MHPIFIFNKIGFNRNRGIKYTYFKLKFLRVCLRVEHWSSVILAPLAVDPYRQNVWQRVFPVTRVFPLWTLTGENERERGLTGWATALDWELTRSDSLAARKELVTGSKVPSDLLQLKSGHSENLDFTHLFFVLHYSSSKYNSSMKRLDVNPPSREM